MQYNKQDYNPELHDIFMALTIKQPYADGLIRYLREIDGHRYAMKSIEVRSRPIKYRGDLLICSSKSPQIAGLDCGMTIGIVELYDIKPISEFTHENWINTLIPKEQWPKIKKGYGWMMRNPRRVIEFPVKGQLGIFKLIYTKDMIIEYPQTIIVDKKGIDLMNKLMKNKCQH